MAASEKRIRSVAVIGAGASGAITAAALAAEEYFDRIQVFERRETPGGTWIYDGEPSPLPLHPGKLPPYTDPPLSIPDELPKITSPNEQERFHKTPIYDTLTTNVPAIAMSLSDIPFAYGPFVPHHIPRQYIENYFSAHKLDTPDTLSLNTTLEDLSLVQGALDTNKKPRKEKWKLTLRKRDVLKKVDIWWEDYFDAVVLANGHYAVPIIPEVKGLKEYLSLFPGRVTHSKTYRSPTLYTSQKVLIIGNSASGHDTSLDLLTTATLPVYQSRRSPAFWEGPNPPPGIVWKPRISEFLPSGRIVFEDGTYVDDIDSVIYCTGYLPSYPFWNEKNNGRPFWDYEKGKVVNTFQHTFFHDFQNLAIVGVPRTLTFRSFEYQAIAIARLFADRAQFPLPSVEEQEKWESEREEATRGRKFHDIGWENGETRDWFEYLYRLAGQGGLFGEGRSPPRLGREVRWAIEHLRKYPVPPGGKPPLDIGGVAVEDLGVGSNDIPRIASRNSDLKSEEEWVLVQRQKGNKDVISFI